MYENLAQTSPRTNLHPICEGLLRYSFQMNSVSGMLLLSTLQYDVINEQILLLSDRFGESGIYRCSYSLVTTRGCVQGTFLSLTMSLHVAFLNWLSSLYFGPSHVNLKQYGRSIIVLLLSSGSRFWHEQQIAEKQSSTKACWFIGIILAAFVPTWWLQLSLIELPFRLHYDLNDSMA